MSVTKSVLSALIGIEIDHRLLRGPDASMTDLLPHRLFSGAAEIARLRPPTLKQVMGMAALDAPDPPRRKDPRRWLATRIEGQFLIVASPNAAHPAAEARWTQRSHSAGVELVATLGGAAVPDVRWAHTLERAPDGAILVSPAAATPRRAARRR